MPNCTYFQNTSSSDIPSHTCRVIRYECEIPGALVFAVIRHGYNQSSSRCSWRDFMVISRPHWGFRQMAFCQHQVGHYTSCSNFCLFWCPRAVCDLKEIKSVKRWTTNCIIKICCVCNQSLCPHRQIHGLWTTVSMYMPWKKKQQQQKQQQRKSTEITK